MKVWKRNAIIATVLVLICAGVYLNWNATQKKTVDFVSTLNESQVLGEKQTETPDQSAQMVANVQEDYFSQIRLSRQESRDGAVELLQETIAYEDGSDTAAQAVDSLDSIISDALSESQIESLVIAKGFEDCVAYMGEDNISIAVSAPADGLAETDVAMISDIVTAQTGYELSDIRIIEVK